MSVTREEYSNSQVRVLLKPQKVTANKLDIIPIDLKGFEKILFTALIGSTTVDLGENNQLHIELQHSNIADNGFTACGDGQVRGCVDGAVIDGNPVTGTFATVNAAVPEEGNVFAASYIGPKRYVKPVIRCVGDGYGGDAGNGAEISISAVLQGAKYLPVAH